MAIYSSILALRIPWTGEPDGLQSMGSRKNQTGLSDTLSLFHLSPKLWTSAKLCHLILSASKTASFPQQGWSFLFGPLWPHHSSPRRIPSASFPNLLQLPLPQLKLSSPFTSNYCTCFLAALHRCWVISITPCRQVWRSKEQVVHKFVAHPLAAPPPICTVQLPSGPLPVLHRVEGGDPVRSP